MVTAPAPVVTARFARPIRDPMLSSVSPSPKREIPSPSRSASRSRSRSAPAPRPNAVEAAPPLSVLAKAEPTRPSIECSDRPPPRRHWHQAEPGSRCPVPKRPSSRRHRSLHPQSGNRPRRRTGGRRPPRRKACHCCRRPGQCRLLRRHGSCRRPLPIQHVAAVRRRRAGRQPEDIAADVDQVKIAERVLAERRRIVDRPRVRRDLRGAVCGNPRSALAAQGENLALDEVGEELALDEVGEEIVTLKSVALAPIDKTPITVAPTLRP